MAPTVTLLRKTLMRGRGPQRLRALVQVTFATAHPGAYTAGTGFEDSAGGGGINLNAILPDKIIDVVGSMVEPRMILLSTLSGFTTNLLGTHGILDFYALTVSNYTSPPTKYLKVRLYGLKTGPVMDEASTDAALDGGTFVVELEYTPISGAEA
jgi:hypothetical protein